MVEVFKCDITTSSVSNLPHTEEIRGVFHCAGVLSDSLIMNTSSKALDTVFKVKLSIVNLLNLCTNLQFAVLFSSTSALFGAGGQVAYSGANTFLDWKAKERSEYDIYSIQWAGWKEIGMSVDTELKELTAERHISPAVGYQALDSIMSLPSGVYSVMDVTSWNEFSSNMSIIPQSHHASFVSNLIGKTTSASKVADKPKSLIDFITSVVGSKDLDISLYSLGFDSLDIVNFRNRLQANFDVSLPLNDFLDQNRTLKSLYDQMGNTV